MKNITSYSREHINRSLQKAREKHESSGEYIRMLFVPQQINDGNFEQVCDIYGRVDPSNFETVMVVETCKKELNKKLSMPSNKFFETPLGKVPVNDFLRNEYCDEDDDFFINDEGFSKEMSLFDQLMILQCLFRNFSVLSIQIGDEEPAIVKELANVFQEVLAFRNALLIFCCDLPEKYGQEFEKIRSLVAENNESGLMNYLHRQDTHINGVSTFISAVLVAKAWNLELSFMNQEADHHPGSLLTAYANQQKVIY